MNQHKSHEPNKNDHCCDKEYEFLSDLVVFDKWHDLNERHFSLKI